MSLTGRSFLKELDFTPEEWRGLLDLAAELKRERREGRETKRLAGKQVALLFEKTSTRTRCAFEVAVADQGGTTTYLDPAGSQIGHKESAADTARVLGRWYDALEYRGYRQDVVETLAAHAGVPVYNGLTDEWHPTQMLADQLTMLEHSDKPIGEIAFAFVGDARNNVGNSLLISGALMGMDVRMVAPESLQNAAEIVAQARHLAERTGARITITDDVASGVAGVDFVYTDVWVSLGEPKEVWAERIELLRDYQVNAELMAKTGNAHAKFMHCLPAFHDLETTVGRDLHAAFGLNGVEVTDDVFESPANIAFDQAENRMHTIKAILVATLT
ncbi:ornithine carbamoyltransferase [Tessaracoccus flavus]|uniref:Ornithine carbamoyltransferase n=1 Tax=Tessaracoccus flavus TaxID=1610493 RepID=A0A1Q2CBG3_9ACTN|nr:ornithine carbamoyltransferase [Tessaracoccus flavus]AQP43453.1 ornithine carbamoyltransferase [Tessaracoccus flavus]SDY83983.1 ornithine carbamoyltransferase [Tessaracoccus flavus]